MATSSGNYSSASPSLSPPPPCSGDDLQQLRKRKRMQSNRESARRSRIRKQKQLDDLTAEIAQISKENNQISNTIDVTTQHYVKMEAHNSVLRAQMTELSVRLQSLNEILSHTAAATASAAVGSCMFGADEFQFGGDGLLNNSWNLVGSMANHQPIMAASEMFDYY